MPTENDHISNILARLMDQKRAYEHKILEIEDAIKGVLLSKKLLNSKEDIKLEQIKAKPIIPYKNRDSIANKVVDWVMKQPIGTEIKVAELSKMLHAKHTAVRSKLAHLVKYNILTYEAHIGFHKKDNKPSGNLFPHDSELVYDSSDNSRRKDFSE